MPTDLTAFFYPKSIAVVGASRSPEKLGAIVLKNILESGFTGDLYPINPNTDTINGVKCYKSVTELTTVPDLAILAIPAGSVLEAVQQLGEKKVKNVVIFASGFKETGSQGEKLENDLITTAKKYELNLLGPNCLGFVNNLAPLNATFAKPPTQKGNLRFISQSGAIAAALFDWFTSNNVGFNEFITLGNKAQLTENHFLEYFLAQSQSSLFSPTSDGLSEVFPIGLYLESISNGDQFLKLTSKIAEKDPIFVIKPGKTKAAAHAMQSHTGALAGEDDVFEAVLAQANITRCESLEEFFDLARAFSWENAPAGPRIAIVSNAGGPAVISADALGAAGLELADLPAETKKKLEIALPRTASIINPVDVLGDALADRYASAIDTVLSSSTVDGLLVILTPQLMTQVEKTAQVISELAKKHAKPIFVSFIGGNLVFDGEQTLNAAKIPSFRFPERAINAIGKMWQFNKKRLEQQNLAEKNKTTTQIKKIDFHISTEDNLIRETIQEAINNNYKTLDSQTVYKVMTSCGITAPASVLAQTVTEAHDFAEKNGWPVVLKLSSPGLLHKADVGGVMLNIMNAEQLEDAWHKLERKTEQLDQNIKAHVKVQVQKDVLSGVEVIIGVKTDPTFGKVLQFGAGGSFAELIEDRNLHLLPITLNDAEKLVNQSKIYKVLTKNSDEPQYPLEKLYDLIVRISKLAELIPEATDIEINPAIITINDVWAVDGKMVMKSAEQKPAASNAPKLLVAKTLEHKNLASQFNYYEFEPEVPLDFKPGQYISVKVASDAIRAYSIATREGTKKFSLLVDTRPGGPGSKFFENLKVGDKMTYLGPFGVFTLNEADGAEHLLFLATGSGISATRCMIDALLKEQKSKMPITLYFGLTYCKEVFWQDYFDQLTKEYPNFNYEISVCTPEADWNGPVGFITELVKKNFADASKCAAYLCGHRAMIADASALLLENGMPKERVYTEKFV